MRPIYDTSGRCAALAQVYQNGEEFLWSAACTRMFGVILDHTDVYAPEDGAFMGRLSADDRLVMDTRDATRPARPFARLNVIRPMAPLMPLHRPRMPALADGCVDVLVGVY